MTKTYFFYAFMLSTLCFQQSEPIAAPPKKSSRQMVAVKGILFLEIIKNTLDAALTASTDGLWPRSEVSFKRAKQLLAQIYLHKNNHPSAKSNACLTHLEDFLENLSELPTHKIHRDGVEVVNETNITLTNLQNISQDFFDNESELDTSEESAKLDKKIQEKAIHFTLFIRNSFLPPLAIYSQNTSWLETAQEKVCDVIDEYPFLCGAAAATTLIAAYWWWNRNNMSPESGSKKLSHQVHLYNSDERVEIMKKRPCASDETFDAEKIECDRQNGCNCGYHAAMNAFTIAKALAGAEEAAPDVPLTKDQIIEIIKRTQLPTANEVEAEIQKFKTSFKASQAQKKELESHNASISQEIIEHFNKHLRAQLKLSSPDDEKTTFPYSYNSETRRDFFWSLHDHLQNSSDLETLAQGNAILEKIVADPSLPERIKSFLRPKIKEGCVKWPDKDDDYSSAPITREEMDALRNTSEIYLQLQRQRLSKGTKKQASDRNERTDRASAYIRAIKAFQSGKTLIMGLLNHDGRQNGTGHWTTKLFIPETGTTSPVRAKVIRIDSASPSASSTDTLDRVDKCFLHDLFNLKLPTENDYQIMSNILNPTITLETE